VFNGFLRNFEFHRCKKILVQCCRALGSCLVNVKYFTEANIAASTISEMIRRVPDIDPNDNGITITDFNGEIKFKDVDFCYPSRPGSVVLRKFNLQIVSGQTVGLVGGSGSGKSTIISLIERFYAPSQGEILLDGIHIENFQLRWLREQIGLVSQEPVLFATSVKENILFGKECASMDEVVSAAKAVNAHEFISQLPAGYDSHVSSYHFIQYDLLDDKMKISSPLLCKNSWYQIEGS